MRIFEKVRAPGISWPFSVAIGLFCILTIAIFAMFGTPAERAREARSAGDVVAEPMTVRA